MVSGHVGPIAGGEAGKLIRGADALAAPFYDRDEKSIDFGHFFLRSGLS